MTLYAAYGSNMSPKRMAEIAPCSPCQSTGWLVGWRLTFGGENLGLDGALATVVEDAQASTFLALYDVPDHDIAALDQWEGVPIGLYRKVKVRVSTLFGDELAWLYTLDAYEGGLPSAYHLALIADAAEEAGAPTDYVADLRSRPRLPGPGTNRAG